MEDRAELRIYMKDLPCYEKAKEKPSVAIKRVGNRFFDLGKIPNEGLRAEIRPFLLYRGTILTLSSMQEEIRQYNVFCRFLQEKEAALDSLQGIDSHTMVQQLKAWLLKQGYRLMYHTDRGSNRPAKNRENEIIQYLKKILRFLEPQSGRPEWEKDIWNIERLDQAVLKTNPIKHVKSLNFTKIPQQQIREEVKQVTRMELKCVCIDTVLAEIHAVKRFSQYLDEYRPNIHSLREVERDDMEAYLTYLNTEALGKKSFRSELHHLKTVFEVAGNILECPGLHVLFFEGDIPAGKKALYKSYSDAELIRLNRHIVTMDEQIARALIIHEMLGTRISDTLTLAPDCLYQMNGHYMIKIKSVKSHEYEKPVSDELVQLIQKSINYTKERYGDTRYIFVSEKDPGEPIQYGMLQYRIHEMIVAQDLRDDQGNLFGVGTHMFRHTYGRKLTEMHMDDYTISRLLGHANTSSVKYYRRMSNKALEFETREMRKSMDSILNDIIGRWEEK